MYKPNQKVVIGLKGLAGSGKDTVANYLVQNHNFTKISFATAVKKVTSVISGWPVEMLQGDTEESRKFRETVVHPDFNMTGRKMLQLIGTELFRTHFDRETWIKIVKRDILELPGNVVISDVRFPNEAAMIQETGGYIFSIQRNSEKLLEVPSHSSEQLFEVENEVVVNNNGTLEELYNHLEELVG